MIISLPSYSEAQLGPAGDHTCKAVSLWQAMAQLMTWGAMGDAGVSKDGRIQAHTVSVI